MGLWDDIEDDIRKDDRLDNINFRNIESALRDSATQLKEESKLVIEKMQKLLIALGREELSAFARIYVNKDDHYMNYLNQLNL